MSKKIKMNSFIPPIGRYEDFEEELQTQQPIRDNLGYYNFIIHDDLTESRFYVCGFYNRWIKHQEDESKIIFHFEIETNNYCWYFQYPSSNELIKHNIHSEDPTEVSQTKGYRAWYHMGKLHRWNGQPAIIHHNGRKLYAFFGEKFCSIFLYIRELIHYCQKQFDYYQNLEMSLNLLPASLVNVIGDFSFDFDLQFIQNQYDMFIEEFEIHSKELEKFPIITAPAKVPTIVKYRSIFGNNQKSKNQIDCVKSLFDTLQNKTK